LEQNRFVNFVPAATLLNRGLVMWRDSEMSKQHFRSLLSIPGFFVIVVVFLLGSALGWYVRGANWQTELTTEAQRIATKHHGIYIPELNLFITKSPEAIDLYTNDRDRAIEILNSHMRKLTER